jgi:hypothetical protein
VQLPDQLSKNWIYRPPNWRWQRAAELETHAREEWSRSADTDRDVIAAVDFRRQVIHGDEGERNREKRRNAHYYAAWCIYTDAQQNRARWELEARLLSRADDETIADRIACSPRTVRIYERWFYNVRDRLKNWGYIFQQLILPLLPQNATEKDYEYIWKYYGFKYGHAMLDSMIYGLCELKSPSGEAAVQDCLSDEFRQGLNTKGALSAKLTPVNWETRIELLNARLKLLESDRAAEMVGAGGNAVRDTFLRGVQESLANLPWVYEEGVRRPGMTVVQIGGASLRTDEALLAAEMPMRDAAKKMLESATFPEKADKRPTVN